MTNEQLADKAYPLDGSEYILSEISIKDNRIGYAQAITDCQEFAEWCSMNGWVYVDFKVMWVNPKSGLEPSTTELFSLFIQEKQSKRAVEIVKTKMEKI